MTAGQRQYALLAILAGSLVVVMVKVLGIGDPTESDPAPSNQAAGPGSPAAAAAAPIVDVGLDRLRTGREELQPADRNPFRFRPKPLPPPPPSQPLMRPQPTAPPVPAGPPPPPPIPLKYIGFAETGGAPRVGFFSDGRGTPIPAKEGDILEGRYRVLRLGTDSTDLVYLDGRGRQTIRLSGQ
jgi:hypothetical protein